MRYFVIDPSGNRYGPADIATLNGWITEGRLTNTMMLEEEGSGIKSVASTVPGLMFPMQQSPGAPQSGPYGQGYSNAPKYGEYPRGGPGYAPGQIPGQKEFTNALILGILSFVCCGLCAIFGLLQANKAMELGHPNANAVRILNIVALVLVVLGVVVYGFIIIGAIGSAGLS